MNTQISDIPDRKVNIDVSRDRIDEKNYGRWTFKAEFPDISLAEVQELLDDVGTPEIWRMERNCKDLEPKSIRLLCAVANYLGQEPEQLWKGLAHNRGRTEGKIT